MISTGQILAAAIVTGAAIGVTGLLARWPPAALVAAALSSFVLIILWRAISNLVGLNDDFIPAISVGDAGCLIAGAVGPVVIGHLRRVEGARSDWMPALAGGIVGFAINVVIL